MSYFGEVDPGSSFQAFEDVPRLFGFVPNLFRAQTLLPRIIEAEVELAAALLPDRALSRNQKGIISLVVAAAYGDRYCFTLAHQTAAYQTTAHQTAALVEPEQLIDQIARDHRQAGLSMPDTALLDFVLKLALSAPWVSGEDIARLRDHGFTDESILEAILITAATDFFCTLSRGLCPAPDLLPRAIPASAKAPPSDRGPYIGGTTGPHLRGMELSPATFPPFAFFQERFGLIPGLFRAQSLRPDVIEAEANALRKLAGPGDLLSGVQKECIFLVGSAVNMNTYCVASHCEMLRRMGISMEQASQIAADHLLADLSEADKRLLDFALRLTARSQGFCRDDIELLRRHGFSDSHILEAVAVTAINGFFNTLQMGLGTTPDFEPVRVFERKEVNRFPGPDHPTGQERIDPDAGLVAQVQRGDLDAFEELVARHSRRVYRMLMGIIGNVEEAQDAMQDTFLKAFQHIGEFQGRSRFSTWLVTIANNTGLQRLRDRKPLESLDEDFSGADEEFRPRQVRAWEKDPEQLCSHAEMRDLVESAMMQLPPKYRVVLVMRDIEQLSGADTAAALGLGISAMKARLLRARLMLREALAPHFAGHANRMSV